MTSSVNMNINWTRDFYLDNEAECKNILMESGNWEKVPLLTDNNVSPGTLVRFKGMIQDMLNPEYFSKNFSLTNSVVVSIIDQSTTEIPPQDDPLMERQVIVCVPIPGLNDWAKDMATNNENETQLEQNTNKRIRLDPACQNNLQEIYVYIYIEEVECELKINSIIDVVGFFDLRSSLEYNEDPEELPSIAHDSYCIHTVQFKTPLNLMDITEEISDCIWKEASNLHAELKLILTQALLGDSLAADYLLFYLVSSIYNRQIDRVPGKFSLNIRGIPMNNEKSYLNKLYSLISYLVVKSKYLSVTIDTMNNMDLIPKKCYDSNRLTSGLLQLSNRTHLVLDETNLQPGKLETKGMLNFQALQNIISNQKIQYDFTYYKIDFNTQIPVLTLSEGKSILPNDIDIVLCPDPSCSNSDELIDSAYQYLNSQLLLLEKLRKYIAIISTIDFKFNEDVLKDIENDYVQMRKADPKNVSPDDLDRYLMISKLMALCLGKNELNKEIWGKCLSLETERKLRNSQKK